LKTQQPICPPREKLANFRRRVRLLLVAGVNILALTRIYEPAMRIDPSTTAPPTVPTATGSTPRVAAQTTNASEPTTTSGSFAPSASLSALLSAVSQTPDVRPGAVASATANLTSGALGTPAAAVDTAAEFLKNFNIVVPLGDRPEPPPPPNTNGIPGSDTTTAAS
jgi:hypothetical protein